MTYETGDADEPMAENASLGGKLARIVAQIPGAVVGGILGSVAGPPGAIIGAVSGTVISAVGSDIVDRVLSPAQERRVGEVYLSAAAAIVEKQVLHGARIRDDGFFDGERSNGAEFVEGVMIAAMGSYEQRRIPYLGNLIANVALSDGLDAAASHTALRVSESLSWIDMIVLGIFADGQSFPMPHHETPAASNWSEWSITEAMRTLIDPPRSLLSHAPKKLEFDLPSYDLNLDALSLTSSGGLLADLMELASIPKSDRRPIYDVITTERALRVKSRA